MPSHRKNKQSQEIAEESSSSEEGEENSASDSEGSESSSSSEGSSDSESSSEDEPTSNESASCADATNKLKSMVLQSNLGRTSPSMAKSSPFMIQSKPHPQVLASLSTPSFALATNTQIPLTATQSPSAAPASNTQTPFIQSPSAAPANTHSQSPSAAPANANSQSSSAASAQPFRPTTAFIKPTMISASSGLSSDYTKALKKNLLLSENDDVRTVADNKRILNGLIEQVSTGIVRFSDIQVSFIGSYDSLDNGKAQVELKKVVGNVLKHPQVLDHELESVIRKHYKDMESGMILKVELKSLSNQTNKDVLLSSSHDQLNGHVAIVKGNVTKRGMFILQAGETKTFDTPICIVNHYGSLNNDSYHENLVLKKLSLRTMHEQQVTESPDDKGKKLRILVPLNLLPKKQVKKSAGNHIVKELADPNKAETYKHLSLLAYIIVTGKDKWLGTGKGKLNLGDLDVIKTGDRVVVRVPKSIVVEAGEQYEAEEEKSPKISSVKLDSVKLQIEPVHTSKFTDVEDTNFHWDYNYNSTQEDGQLLFGTTDSSVITNQLSGISLGLKKNLIRDIGITRKITAVLNISVIPSLASIDGENQEENSGSAVAKVI